MLFGLVSFILGAVVGTVLIWLGIVRLIRWKAMKDTFTRKIVDVEPGRVEIQGKISTIPGKELRAPLSGRSCLRYEIVVKEASSVNEGSWNTVVSEKKEVPFLVSDDSGSIVVDARGVTVQGEDSFHREQTVWNNLDEKTREFIRSRGVDEKGVFGLLNNPLRIKERIVPAQGDMYVLGDAVERGMMEELKNNYMVSPYTTVKNDVSMISFEREEKASKDLLSASLIFLILGTLSLMGGIGLAIMFWSFS